MAQFPYWLILRFLMSLCYLWMIPLASSGVSAAHITLLACSTLFVRTLKFIKMGNQSSKQIFKNLSTTSYRIKVGAAFFFPVTMSRLVLTGLHLWALISEPNRSDRHNDKESLFSRIFPRKARSWREV